MIKEAIEKLMQAENLTYDQVKESVDEIMTGQASPALIASFLTALSIKGETDEEIAGAAESMRSKALPLDSDGDILDIVGTGGDKSGSFNISTTAGIIAAAAGVRIAKHGNRAASSRSGAADCLEALGVNMDRGHITIDDHCQTNVKGLYAIGDCAGAPWLAHKASHEGIHAAEHIAAYKTPNVHSPIAGCTYAQPQVASVGVTEQGARADKREVKIGRFPFRVNGKAVAAGEVRDIGDFAA